MIPQDILPLIQGAKILDSDANLTIPNNVQSQTKVREMVHGWVRVEIAGKIIKIRENVKPVTIKRQLLKCIDPTANLNALRPREIKKAFDDFAALAGDTAKQAAEKKLSANGQQVEKQIQKTLSGRRERMKRQAYVEGCDRLRQLFSGPLFDMEEDELLEIYRLNRVDHIMTS